MTTAEHAQSARTGTCPTSDELKQYLAGWSDEAQAEQLEEHLQLCPICEAAIGQMETRPDTLLQSLQSTVAAPVVSPVARSVSDRDSAAPSLEVNSSPANDPPINAALAKAKQLMDSPVETAADKARTVWQPMHRELGMYELIKPLGRGGMGAVYLASHRQLKKQVAIKLLPILSSEDSDVRARFDREIRVVGKLNHPSIVTATDAGEIDGTQFLVMEYVPGLDLSRLARLMGRLPVADACELIRQAALGLSCAHAEGVVHRDVKPSNLMLDESGRIRILDFGLAQLSVWDEASVDLTTVGQLMGTLDYMAPEQAEVSGGVDYRADLYALGATLFRLLCGRAPLAAAPNQSPFEKLRLLANHQPPKLSTLCPEAPDDLVKLVASLLSRNPSDRPASAAHVAEQLAPFAEGSKLVELLQQAKEKAATSPELLKKSAFADLPQFGSLAPAEPAPLPASYRGGRSKLLRRLLLAASLPILIIAGILIKLETSKGQLVIESDVDNVSVKLLKDGKPVDGIQVSHGTTSTRLNADNYEITIDGPTDGLVIDNDKFTLKNGETVVARITTATLNAAKPNAGFGSQVATDLSTRQPAHSKLSANDAQPSERVFHGRTLPEWLNLLRVERSSEMVMEGLSAVSTLGKDADRESALPMVVELLRSIDDDDTFVLAHCFRTLFELLPNDSYVGWWAREYESGSTEWRRKLATELAIDWNPPSEQDFRFTAFLKWYEQRVAPQDGATPAISVTPAERESLADMIVKLGDKCIDHRANEGLVSADRIMRLLQPLPDRWWLEQTFDLANRGHGWKVDFVDHIIDRAAKIIANQESDSAAVVEAALIVKYIAEKHFRSIGDEGFAASRLSSQTFEDAVDSRLLKIADQHRQLSEMHLVDQRLKWFCGVTQPNPCPIDFAGWHVDVDSANAKGNELIALLELCPGSGLLPNARIELAEGSPRSRGLHAIWKLSKAIEADVSAMFLDQPESSEKWLHLTVRWPSLDVQAYDAIDKRTPLDPASFWRDQTQSKDRWFLALLHDHPVLLRIDEILKAKETTDLSALEKSPEQQTTSSSSVPMVAPLYNGQPLSYWLSALKKDRSPAKQRECMEAIRRLADVADSEEATTSLTQFLRADFGEERDAAADELAFQCIARLNPDQRFLAWWMKEFQTGDEAWQSRLAGLGSHLKFSSGDQLAEFEHWVKTEKAQNKLSPQNVNHVADFIAKLGSTSDCSREVSDRLVQLLDDMTMDDRSWWLAAPHQVRFEKLSDRYEFMQLFAIRSCQITSDVIGNPESSSTQIAQAAMVFHSHMNHWPTDPQSKKPPEHLGLFYSETNRSRFLKAADGYLKRVANEPARMTDFVKVPREFDTEAKYHNLSRTLRYEIKFSHEVMQGGGLTDPAPDRDANTLMEVLDAIYLYGYVTPRSGPPDPAQTRWFSVPLELADNVKALHDALRPTVPNLNEKGKELHIEMDWPDLGFVNAHSGSGFFDATRVNIWGDHTPTADDWLRLCLLSHEVLNAPVVGEESPDLSTSGANPSMPTAQAETPQAMPEAPATPAPAPLYEGKPLEHWLDMLSRERSVLGLKAAIEGCTALVDDENADAVTDALLKALPGLYGELQVTDKETNSVWTLDYSAGDLLRKANPGSKFFEVWVKARSQSPDKKWNERLLKLANYRKLESPDDVAPLIEWGRAVLTESDKSNSQDSSVDAQAAMDAAVLLRNMSGISYLGMINPFVDVVAPILTESPKLDDAWWLSEPLMYRGPNGSTELWPAPIKAKISETAVRVLEKAESDSAAIVQACMILANGAVLTEEQKTAVLTSIQRRLEDTSNSPEALTAMVPVSASFSHFAAPSAGSIAEPGFVGLQIEVGRSWAADIPVADTSLVLQLLNVVSSIDKDKRCQPQLQMIFESSRDVFEIVNSQRLADLASRENTIGGQFGLRQRSSRLPLSLQWPGLTTHVDASTPIRPGSPDSLQAMAFKMLWGEHVPSKLYWMKYLILVHPAMADVVTAEIKKAGGAETEK